MLSFGQGFVERSMSSVKWHGTAKPSPAKAAIENKHRSPNRTKAGNLNRKIHPLAQKFLNLKPQTVSQAVLGPDGSNSGGPLGCTLQLSI